MIFLRSKAALFLFRVDGDTAPIDFLVILTSLPRRLTNISSIILDFWQMVEYTAAMGSSNQYYETYKEPEVVPTKVTSKVSTVKRAQKSTLKARFEKLVVKLQGKKSKKAH